MGKLKDKLYYLLVEKNGNICREYQGYVNSHKSEHSAHRGRSWALLLKLNWHYRILRKTNPMLSVPQNTNRKVKLPYLNGSESEGFKRRDVIYFARDLLKYDVISFDIFDTLILRPFAKPVDLFLIIGSRLNMMNFMRIRIDAERDARAEANALYGNSEITIFDIYKKINHRTGLDINKGVETEFQTELDYCFANPYMMRVFKLLKEHGKKIIITSDMYIPHDMMERLLASCGYTGYDRLYVSCDYYCNKRNGGLYKVIKRDYPGCNIAHVGDNRDSDINSADRCGIKSVYYKNCHEIGAPYRADGMSDLVGSLYAGIVNTHLHNGVKTYAPYYEYGFIYGGLYILGYCNWIYRRAKEEGVEKILFLARDGDIYHKVFNMMFDDMPNEYVYWSRIANSRYTADINRDDILTRMIHYKAYSAVKCTLEDVLISLGLNELVPKLKTHKLKPSMLLVPDLEKRFEDFFVDYWDEIEKSFAKEENIVKAYFESIIDGYKKVAIVDVGWIGSGPIGIKYLIENKWEKQCEVKCYLAASHHTITTYNINEIMNDTTEAYMFSRMYNRNLYDIHKNTNKGTNNIYFELLTQACTPSFSGFSEDGSYIFDVPEIKNYDMTRQIQAGIMDFSRIYFEITRKDTYARNISGYDAYLPYRLAIRDVRYVKNVLHDATFSRTVGVNLKNQKQETLNDIFENVNL